MAYNWGGNPGEMIPEAESPVETQQTTTTTVSKQQLKQ
jgi:hypothetical protein